MQMLYTKKQSGLAFLEITVVIAIIILGIVLISSIAGEAQKRTRDSRRISDISQIQKALNIYNISANRFPVEPQAVTISGNDSFSQAIQNEFAPQRVPTDPLFPTYSYQYVSSNGLQYELIFCLETNGIPNRRAGCENKVTQ